MASNTSAVLDVITESKEISSILKENKEYDRSNASTYENSLIQSPSMESFSTLQDIENLSELNMDENSDLCVKIDNPQKHLETLETYITFRITTKVARIEFLDNEYIVRRRYNDFLWLRQKLVEGHPFCIVPPLPGKHSLIGQLDRYSKDFILLRMKALNVFMSRVVQHPILSCNEYLKLFLTAKQPDFNLQRRQRTNSTPKVPSQSLLNYSNSKCHHIEFDKTRSYIHNLSEKLITIEKISSRINKERQDLVTELNSYYPIFNCWASQEPHLAAMLQSIANALEKSATAQSMVIFNYSSVIGTPIKEFLQYIDVIHETLNKRDAYQNAFDNSIDELSKRRSEKDKLLSDAHSSSRQGGFSLWKQPSCDEKLEKLGTYIPQLVKKVETNQDALECANEQLRSDLQRWQIEKQQHIKKMLLDFANKQIEYYETSVSAWEHVANNITPQNHHMQNAA